MNRPTQANIDKELRGTQAQQNGILHHISDYLQLYLGILSCKFLLRQHDNGSLIVVTITTMKNPGKIQYKKEEFHTQIIKMFLKHKLEEFQETQFFNEL